MSFAPSTPDTHPAKPDLEPILDPLRPAMEALSVFLEKEVESFPQEVRSLVTFTFQHSGKRLRPILVFLSAEVEGSNYSEEVIRAAAIVELVHLATLVHDDILDGAEMRHRTATATSRYGPSVAVLLGDALFAHALKLASEFPGPEICRAVASATRQVCCGEIEQSFARGDADLSLEAYFRMIDLKTAELFAVSARLGSSLAGQPEPVVRAKTEFARRLGIAYQIYDDLADILEKETKSGKTLGTDFNSGKYTLPFILYLQSLEKEDREAWLAEEHSLEEWKSLMQEKGAIEASENRLRAEIKAARKTLNKMKVTSPGLLQLPGFLELLTDRLPVAPC